MARLAPICDHTFPNIASSMQAPQSGASSATPKAAVPSEAQSSGLDIDTALP